VRRQAEPERYATGALLELPAGRNERVFGRWGPGPARDVLAALFNGSRFNYLMLGTTANPAGLSRIVLSLRPTETADNTPLQQTAAFSPDSAYVEPLPQNVQPVKRRLKRPTCNSEK
jgi:hypothetical protein